MTVEETKKIEIEEIENGFVIQEKGKNIGIPIYVEDLDDLTNLIKSIFIEGKK